MAKIQAADQLSDKRAADTLSFYEGNADVYAQQTASVDLTGLHQKFLSLLPKGGRILDVGCGSGRDLRIFKRLGFDCIGIDPSSNLAHIAHEYSGCEIILAGVENLDFKSCFDGVWACASLLHLPRHHFSSALNRILIALKPAGVLFISMQQGAGEFVAPDGRFYSRYSSPELNELVADAGFVVLEEWVTDDAQQKSRAISWINILARRREE